MVRQSLAHLPQGRNTLIESEMRPDHRPEIFQAAIAKEFERCHPIQQNAVCYSPEDPTGREIFVKQREVIPEIKIGLAR